LELEKLELEEILLDSVTNSERDYARAKLRYADVVNELSVLYDKPFPEPLPRYQVAEHSVEVSANIIGGQIELATNANVALKIKRQDNVAHLGIIEPEESCLLPWARVALLKCLTRLSFLYFDAKVVQYQSDGDMFASGLKDTGLKDAGLKDTGNGWWVRERSSFEVAEGYIRAAQTSIAKKHKRKFRRKHKANSVSR
jgi:hypothetical protein